MAIKVGINGFGRIGRLAFRLIENLDDIEVVAVNDLTDARMLSHLLKYDSSQGRFDGSVELAEGGFLVNSREVAAYSEKNPEDIPWGKHEVDVVLEATGVFRTKDKAERHLAGGAKRVIVTAPSSTDVKSVVFGVNQGILDGSETVISAASCTTNCLAPMAMVLHKNFGIKAGTMTTIHAYTGDQMVQDGPHWKGDLRRARAAAENIVPNSTGAAKAIGLVIPELKGRLSGHAQRVPTPTGSLTELVTVLNQKVTVDEVNAAMRTAADGESFAYNTDEIVSSDVVGMEVGSLFDATQTAVIEADDGTQLVTTVAWYDNEMGYTTQLLRLIRHLSAIGG